MATIESRSASRELQGKQLAEVAELAERFYLRSSLERLIVKKRQFFRSKLLFVMKDGKRWSYWGRSNLKPLIDAYPQLKFEGFPIEIS